MVLYMYDMYMYDMYIDPGMGWQPLEVKYFTKTQIL